MNIKESFKNISDSKFGIFSLYIILLILGLNFHEMWRDEYEEYLQARDSDGIFGLKNAMSQGHAMLWQSCLWLITRFSHNPIWMKIFHGIIASAFAFVLLFKSPFKIWQAAMLLSGYFLLFEYAVISRCYAFGVLFFFVFAYFYSKQKKITVQSSITIFFLANTSVYAMMLSVIICLWVFISEKLFLFNKTEYKKYLWLILSSIGILIAYLQIRPGEDNSFPVHRVILPFDNYRFQVAITQFFSAFVPICKFQSKFFWNTNFMMDKMGIVSWYFPLAVFIFVTIPFIKKFKILLLWLMGVVLILFFQYHTGFRFARYYGHFFIFWIVCYWLMLKFYNENLKLNNIIFSIILASQSIGGIMMYNADRVQKFSTGHDAALWLKKHGYSKHFMIASVDFAMSPIAAELNRKIYYMQHKTLCSYTKWDKKRLNSTYKSDIIEAIEEEKSNKPVIFIASHPIEYFDYFNKPYFKTKLYDNFIFEKYKVKKLVYFPPGIEYYERYWIFEITKI